MSSKNIAVPHKCSPVEKGCPIPNTHRRLEEVHQLWHQAAQTYHEPTKFRMNVNAIIQAIRNVTFVLQNEKQNIPGFDDWYEKWREHLRENDLMRWLRDARNRVVKQGDLSAESKARVVIKNWQDFRISELDVAPFLSAKQIAIDVCKRLPEDFLKKFGDAVIFVERRWAVSDLPDQELLDVFSYAYRQLSKFVKEAHQLCGYDMRASKAGIPMKNYEEISCFADLERIRTAYINPKNGELIDISKERFHISKVDAEKASKRYNIAEVNLQGIKNGDDPFVHAETFLAIAKKILVKDRFHIPMVFLILPKGGIMQMVLQDENQEDKYVSYRQVAKEVEARKATAVIFISEAWYIQEEESEGKRPSESPNRKEALRVVIACADGRTRSYTTTFERSVLGKIKLGETSVEEGDGNFFLNPIRDVWAKWGNASSKEV